MGVDERGLEFACCESPGPNHCAGCHGRTPVHIPICGKMVEEAKALESPLGPTGPCKGCGCTLALDDPDFQTVVGLLCFKCRANPAKALKLSEWLIVRREELLRELEESYDAIFKAMLDEDKGRTPCGMLASHYWSLARGRPCLSCKRLGVQRGS